MARVRLQTLAGASPSPAARWAPRLRSRTSVAPPHHDGDQDDDLLLRTAVVAGVIGSLVAVPTEKVR